MVATNVALPSSADYSRAQLWAIIYNGRQFLQALEEFAATNFPDEPNNEGSQNTSSPSQQEFDRTCEQGSAAMADTSAHSTEETTISYLAPNEEQEQEQLPLLSPSSNKEDLQAILDTPLLSAESSSEVDAANPGAALDEARSAAIGLTKIRFSTILQEDIKSSPDITGSAAEDQGEWPKSYLRPVVQYCAETGAKLGNFKSGSDAARQLAGASDGSKFRGFKTGIGRVLRGERRSYASYYFRYADDATTLMPTFPISPSLQSVAATVRESTRKQEQRVIHPFHRLSSLSDALLTLEQTEPQAKKRRVSSPSTVCTAAADQFFWEQVASGKVPIAARPAGVAGEASSSQSKSSPSSRKRTKSESIQFGKTVLQYSAETGTLLGKFKSAAAAARGLAEEFHMATDGTKFINYKNAISRVLRGERPSYAGQYYRYANDTKTPMPTFPIPPPRRGGRRLQDLVEEPAETATTKSSE